MANREIIPIQQIRPALLPLDDIRDLLRWYRLNLCEIELRDPRGFRVRFLPENFVHLIKLTNKFGVEPKNARMAIQEIERGRIKFARGACVGVDCANATGASDQSGGVPRVSARPDPR